MHGRLTFVLLLALFTACDSSSPTLPTAPSQQPAPSTPPIPTPPPKSFPPLSGPSRTFVFDRELTHAVQDYTKNSRFVLYDTGGFVLQYPRGEYRGSMARDGIAQW
jgi:hypothetical protein